MNSEFDDSELFFRVVRPKDKFPRFWKEDGTLSSAAFKDKNGLSVDRTNNASPAEIAAQMLARLEGVIFSFSLQDCRAENIMYEWKPVEDDEYHCLVFKDSVKKELTQVQAKHLAQCAKEYTTT